MSDMAEESVQGVQKETDEHAVSDQKRSCKPLFTYDMLLEPMPNLSQPSSTLCRWGLLFVSCDRLLYYCTQSKRLSSPVTVWWWGNVFAFVCACMGVVRWKCVCVRVCDILCWMMCVREQGNCLTEIQEYLAFLCLCLCLSLSLCFPPFCGKVALNLISTETGISGCVVLHCVHYSKPHAYFCEASLNLEIWFGSGTIVWQQSFGHRLCQPFSVWSS